MAEIWLSFKEILGPWAIPAAGALAVLFIVMVRGILAEPGRAFRWLVLAALVAGVAYVGWILSIAGKEAGKAYHQDRTIGVR